jgi:hypothetical protein
MLARGRLAVARPESRCTNLDGERRLSHATVSQHHQLVQGHLSVRHVCGRARGSACAQAVVV